MWQSSRPQIPLRTSSFTVRRFRDPTPRIPLAKRVCHGGLSPSGAGTAHKSRSRILLSSFTEVCDHDCLVEHGPFSCTSVNATDIIKRTGACTQYYYMTVCVNVLSSWASSDVCAALAACFWRRWTSRSAIRQSQLIVPASNAGSGLVRVAARLFPSAYNAMLFITIVHQSSDPTLRAPIMHLAEKP